MRRCSVLCFAVQIWKKMCICVAVAWGYLGNMLFRWPAHRTDRSQDHLWLGLGLDSPHVSPRCLSLFLNPHQFCRVKGLLSVGIYLRRSLSKRKCVVLVVLRTRVLAPAPLCLIVPNLSFFIFVGNDEIQSSSCFIRQHAWDVLLLCY